jgi:hypothetical protein
VIGKGVQRLPGCIEVLVNISNSFEEFETMLFELARHPGEQP